MSTDMRLPESEYDCRLDKVREAMADREYDVFVVYADEYRPGDAFYLSNFKPINVLEEAHQFVIVPIDQEPVMVTGTLNSHAAQERTWLDDVHPFTELEVALADVRDRAGGISTVGLAGEDLLPVNLYESITSVLSEQEFVHDETLLARLRQRKSSAEITMLEAAARVGDESLGDAVEALEVGMSETDLAAVSEYGARRREAEIGSDYVIMAGEKTRYPTWRPHPDHRIESGDYVIVDASPNLRGYSADVAITAIAGDGDDEQWETLQEANDLVDDVIEEAMYPGMLAGDLYDRVLERVDEAGWTEYFLPWVQGVRAIGHGVGIDVVEWPNLGPDVDVALDSGMVLSLKLDLHGIPSGGIRVERMVVVEENGVRGLNFPDPNEFSDEIRQFL